MAPAVKVERPLFYLFFFTGAIALPNRERLSETARADAAGSTTLAAMVAVAFATIVGA